MADSSTPETQTYLKITFPTLFCQTVTLSLISPEDLGFLGLQPGEKRVVGDNQEVEYEVVELTPAEAAALMDQSKDTTRADSLESLVPIL